MDKVRSQRINANHCHSKGMQALRGEDETVSQQKSILKLTMRALVMAMVIIMAFAPYAVRAQGQQEATQISIGAPAQVNVGKRLTVQAMLVDSHGNPIPKETVYFTTQADFLHNSSDVVLAQAVTNSKGQAVAEFTDDFSSTITLQAEFRGDAQYASSNATTQIAIDGQNQVYAEHVGVNIPGFNVPPGMPPMASVQLPELNAWRFIANLWPAMNAWPIAAALIIVWSLYLVAVRFMLRIATSKKGDMESTIPVEHRRWL